MSWQNKFSDSVSTIAFHLTLSKRMVYTLEIISENNIARHFDENFNHFIPAVKSLRERGLVEHSFPAFEDGRHHRLTPAGEHVVALLKLAGLIRNLSAVTEAA